MSPSITLIIRSGKKAGQKIRISKPKFMIGRAEDCHLRPHSELVSRHHCALIIEEGYVGIKDFGSRNGTYVNGQRIAGEQALKSGDRIRVGNLEFEVQIPERKPLAEKQANASAAKAATGNKRSESTDEIDLVALFGEPGPASSETKAYSPAGEVPQDVVAQSATDNATNAEPGRKPPQDGKIVGVPPSRYKPKAPTPRDAAAEALRKFFGQK